MSAALRLRATGAAAVPPRLAPARRTELLVLAAALACGLAAAGMVLLGKGVLILAAAALAGVWLLILARWERGLFALLAYLPFAGIPTLALYPWEGHPAAHPVLWKDAFFVLPAYAGFLLATALRRRRDAPRHERMPAILMAILAGLVVAQMFNPGVPSRLVALIGAKVWLFYLPLFFLAAAAAADRTALVRLFRLLTALAIAPCLIGIAEYAMSRAFGYREVMELLYGAAATHATQSFTFFEVGAGQLAPRIPSTFTFVTQYFAFTMAMLVPAYVVARSDPAPGWRRAGWWVLGLVAAASLLSGARAGFVFAPLVLFVAWGLDRGIAGMVRALVFAAGIIAAVLAVLRVAAADIFSHVWELLVAYGRETALGDLLLAIAAAPLGSGTGTNTGPARHALDNPEAFVGLENYYAKAVLELGLPGLAAVVALFASILWIGFRAQARARAADPQLVPAASALLAFALVMAFNCFKGWLIDLDPINVYYWVFAGVLARLSFLIAEPGPPAESEAER